MKKITLLILSALPIFVMAQSINIRVVANDGSVMTTNTMTLSSDRVQGLLVLHGENNARRTNSGLPVINFSFFCLQEFNDKSEEWRLRAGNDSALALASAMGATNITSIPIRVSQKWFELTLAQRTNAINYLSQIEQ